MKTNKLVLALSSITLLSLFSCTKDPVTPGITFQVRNSAAVAPIVGSVTGASVQWTAGFANTVEIEFEAKNKNVEIEYKSEANQRVNLFSTLSTLGVVTVPAGTYEDIEFEMEVKPLGTEPALQLTGTYTNVGIVNALVFKLNTSLEIESKKSNITIAEGSSLKALTTLNFSLITTGVTASMLDNATRTNNTIEISATVNSNIYEIMLNNLKTCGGVEVSD